MSDRSSVDPALAVQNPDAYRARVGLMDAHELSRHLRSLSRDQMSQHLRAVLTDAALAPRAAVDVDIRFFGGALESSMRFTPSTLRRLLGASGQGSTVFYRDGFPPAVHGTIVDVVRDLTRGGRMARPNFTLRFQFEPFSLVPLEGFIDVSRQLVASELELRRFVLAHYPERHERGITEPACITLFAFFETEHREAVRVELASTTYPGYEERLIAWVRDRVTESAVPFEQQGSLRAPA